MSEDATSADAMPGDRQQNDAIELWPIFICYRRVDGSDTARRLYELLDKWETFGPDGERIQIDAYLDETMPGVGDWRDVHGPYLRKARALIVVCTPGSKLVEGDDDWVQLEIDWWMESRETAPILVDPLGEGARFVPDQIHARWPEIQRISLIEKEWKGLSGAELEEKTFAVRRQVIGTILPSGAAVYAQELRAEQQRARRLRCALVVAVNLILVSVTAGGYAYFQRVAADRQRALAEASLLDVKAADRFTEANLLATRWNTESRRRGELSLEIAAAAEDLEEAGEPGVDGQEPPPEDSLRIQNLRHELAQLDADMRAIKAQSSRLFGQGRRLLTEADGAWRTLADSGVATASRTRPAAPHVFTVELINAGGGESLLIQYGTPDDVRLVLVNTGPGRHYRRSLEPYLRRLGHSRYEGGPIPLELIAISDRDEEKTGGLDKLLKQLAEADSPDSRIVDIGGVWANIFRVEGGRGLRASIQRSIDRLELPWNQPFGRLVRRPDSGRVRVELAGGLEVFVLGPTLEQLRQLHRWVQRNYEKQEARIEDFPDGTEFDLSLDRGTFDWSPKGRSETDESPCRPSQNAANAAGGNYRDESVVNLASLVLLFRFQGRTFLYTGDSRGDWILKGLESAGMLIDGGIDVDLMSIPHLGSDRNVRVDFFERVRAAGYLFSGDGRHNNPEITTVASMITARGCERYRMYFVNREGNPRDGHGARLDEFFEREAEFQPNYRRVFRSEERGSVTINLLGL